ncbi:MAG: hypothetical protein AABW48_03255 [Nanoarchaeota archaeon]
MVKYCGPLEHPDYYCPIDGRKLRSEAIMDGEFTRGERFKCYNCGADYSTNPEKHPQEARLYLREIAAKIKKIKTKELQPLEKIIEAAGENGLLK